MRVPVVLSVTQRAPKPSDSYRRMAALRRKQWSSNVVPMLVGRSSRFVAKQDHPVVAQRFVRTHASQCCDCGLKSTHRFLRIGRALIRVRDTSRTVEPSSARYRARLIACRQSLPRIRERRLARFRQSQAIWARPLSSEKPSRRANPTTARAAMRNRQSDAKPQTTRAVTKPIRAPTSELRDWATPIVNARNSVE